MDIRTYLQYEPLFGAWRIDGQAGEDCLGGVFSLARTDGAEERASLLALTIPDGEEAVRAALADGMDRSGARAYFESFVTDRVKEIEQMYQLRGGGGIAQYREHLVIEHRDGLGWDILIRTEPLTPLAEHLSRRAATQREVIKLGIDLCRALETCQQQGIVLRDLRPERVCRSPLGDYKLASLSGDRRSWQGTQPGLASSPANYMAPEVYRGEDYGRTVDTYSLGLILYQLLNGGRAPFLPEQEGLSPEVRTAALRRRLSGAALPPPAYARPALAEVICRACAYRPQDRYASPAGLRRALEDLLLYPEEEPAPIQQPQPQPTPRPAPQPAPQPRPQPMPTPQPTTAGGMARQRVSPLDALRRAMARDGDDAPPYRQRGEEELLPVLLTMFAVNFAYSVTMSRADTTHPFLSLTWLSLIWLFCMGTLMIFYAPRCSLHTALLCLPAMLAGMQLGNFDMKTLWRYGDELEVLLYRLFPPLDHEQLRPLLLCCLACAALTVWGVRSGWASRKVHLASAGAALLLGCALLPVFLQRPFSTLGLLYLLHILPGCAVLTAVLIPLARRAGPPGRYWGGIAGAALLIACLTAKVFYSFGLLDALSTDFPLYLHATGWQGEEFLLEALVLLSCTLAGRLAVRGGLSRRRTYAAVIATFAVSCVCGLFVIAAFSTWCSGWMASLGILRRIN